LLENVAWALGAVVILVAIRFVKGKRNNTDARLRDEWGKALDRWRDFAGIAEYHRWRAAQDTGSTYMDDRTWSDLHLDLVFAAVDRTRSSIGNQLLYHRLRSAPSEVERLRFESLVLHYGQNADERLNAQRLLSLLSHSAGYDLWRLCRDGEVETQWWYGLFPLLALTVVGLIVAVPFWPRALLVILGLLVVNIAFRIKVAHRVFHLLGTFKEIGPLLQCAKSVLADPAVRDLFAAMPVAGDLIAVEPLRRSARWASRNNSVENEILGAVYEYLNLFFMLDANAVLFAARTLKKSGSSLLRIIESLGEIDAAISTASLRAGEGHWAVPIFARADRPLELTGAWHPLVENAVANSVVMRPGRGLIITGSNMSGKSTFLRTVGVTVVLAQTLNTCPARAYSGPRVSVRSAIGRSDDLTEGKSYYLVEVEAVLELLKLSENANPHLFLFDELFRGTNTIERLSAGEAVLKALLLDAESRARHIVLAATHDGEMVQMLEETYDPYSFEETIEPGGLTFAYNLLSGPARTRSAIALLEIKGAPAEVVSQARARAAELDLRSTTR